MRQFAAAETGDGAVFNALGGFQAVLQGAFDFLLRAGLGDGGFFLRRLDAEQVSFVEVFGDLPFAVAQAVVVEKTHGV